MREKIRRSWGMGGPEGGKSHLRRIREDSVREKGLESHNLMGPRVSNLEKRQTKVKELLE